MSTLNGPRINFWGGGSTNVDTANNADNGVVDLLSATVTSPDTDAEIIEALRQPSTNQGQNYYTVAGWNYYGDHQVAFMNAKVSSSGQPGAVSTRGELVGLPVFLLGSLDPVSGQGPYGGAVMVDLDPTSSQTTQIYVGGLQIGADQPKLQLRTDTRCHSQLLGLRYNPATAKPPYLTPGSVFANGTFQIGFPKAAIVAYDATSPLLRALIEAPGALGLVLRFSMFEFMPATSTDAVQADYKNNYNSANPSLGRIIGTLGPWFADEPATCPAGRLLQNTQLGGAQGLAHLDAANQRLSLDLSSALQASAIRQDPKANSAPIGPNIDYGDLQIGTAAGTVATTPSLPATYYQFGGIYDVPLSAAATATLAANPIVIGSSLGGLAIAESPVRVYSDSRNLYLDDVGGRATINLKVFELGGPLKVPTTLNLSAAASGSFPTGTFLNFPTTLTLPAGANGIAFDVTDNGGPGGFLALNLAIGSAASPAYFINFRKYPVNDFSAIIAAGNVPWSLVYQECLRFYYVLFPAMSKRIPLNDEPTIRAVGAELLKRLSPRYRDTTLCMPLTRDLSPGKIALLQAFVNGS